MISRLVMWVSTLASLVLLVSFGWFAVDELRDGSNQQIAKLASELGPGGASPTPKVSGNINQANPPPRTERIRERRHGQVREVIDDGNDILVSPFTGIVQTNSIWVQRGIPGLIALLLFGVGLRILAGYLPGGGRR